MNISQQEFNNRHDFNCSDLEILRANFSWIKFIDIPEAWIYPIDKALLSLSRPNNILEIRQIHGLILFSYYDLAPGDEEKLKAFERDIYSIDEDIRDDGCITWN